MSFLSRVFYGVDLDEEQQRGDELDARLRAQNAVDYAPGGRIYERVEREEGTAAANDLFPQVEQHEATSQTGNVTDQVGAAFGEGLNEGYDRIRRVTGSFVGEVLSAPFKLIPWQLWLVGIGVAFFYFGGLAWLKSKLVKA